MRKLLGVSLALAAMLIVSCSKKENSYDFAQIIYPYGAGTVVYADQILDTLRFSTTYDWSLSIDGDWLRINPDSMAGTVPEGYYMMVKVGVSFDANTTGEERVGYVYFNADGRSLVTAYAQRGHLNIKRPNRMDGRYQLYATATQESDSVIFSTYSHDWTLEFKDTAPDWMHLAADAGTSGRAGEYKVKYTLDPNTTTSERQAVLVLRSRGVMSEIQIKQAGAPKEDDGNDKE